MDGPAYQWSDGKVGGCKLQTPQIFCPDFHQELFLDYWNNTCCHSPFYIDFRKLVITISSVGGTCFLVLLRILNKLTKWKHSRTMVSWWLLDLLNEYVLVDLKCLEHTLPPKFWGLAWDQSIENWSVLCKSAGGVARVV